MIGLESLHGRRGFVSFGWVEPGLYYSRFVGDLSAELGVAHLAHLQAAIESVSGLRYFVDARALSEYDLLARSAFMQLVLSQRSKLSDLVVLAWRGRVEQSRALLGSIGQPLVVASSRAEFHRLLNAAASGSGDVADALHAGDDGARWSDRLRAAHRVARRRQQVSGVERLGQELEGADRQDVATLRLGSARHDDDR
jgi:hypothetical protein